MGATGGAGGGGGMGGGGPMGGMSGGGGGGAAPMSGMGAGAGMSTTGGNAMYGPGSLGIAGNSGTAMTTTHGLGSVLSKFFSMSPESIEAANKWSNGIDGAKMAQQQGSRDKKSSNHGPLPAVPAPAAAPMMGPAPMAAGGGAPTLADVMGGGQRRWV